MSGPSNQAAILRNLLPPNNRSLVICPGVYDPLTAKIAVKEGYLVVNVELLGIATTRLGESRLHPISIPVAIRNAVFIPPLLPSTPVIVDLQINTEDPSMLPASVEDCIKAGVAAIQIHDRIAPEQYYPPGGRVVFQREVFYKAIECAVTLRKNCESNIVIIARTDAQYSHSNQEALDRLTQAIHDGADVASVGDVTSREDAGMICSMLQPTPVIYSTDPGTPSVQLTVTQASELGFCMILFPGLAHGSVLNGMRFAAQSLKETGNQMVAANYSQNDIDVVLHGERVTGISRRVP
ncbi:Pyruvate/Phosphoenolpyruvate kinase-like domain-containing protein [Aspergillus spectabilis]